MPNGWVSGCQFTILFWGEELAPPFFHVQKLPFQEIFNTNCGIYLHHGLLNKFPESFVVLHIQRGRTNPRITSKTFSLSFIIARMRGEWCGKFELETASSVCFLFWRFLVILPCCEFLTAFGQDERTWFYEFFDVFSFMIDAFVFVVFPLPHLGRVDPSVWFKVVIIYFPFLLGRTRSQSFPRWRLVFRQPWAWFWWDLWAAKDGKSI